MHQQHRQLIVISGQFEQCVSTATHLIKHLDYLWLSNSIIAGQDTLAMSKATTVLGQEYDAVVFDAFNNNKNDDKLSVFNANAFGAVTGTIIGGGYLLLLTPDLKKWANKSLFLQRFSAFLQQSSAVFLNANSFAKPLIPPSHSLDKKVLFLDEQHQAFAMMERVIAGHRRRPLVLTSDRGRGKSTLLGHFSASLLEKDFDNIIVTAPSLKIASTLFQAVENKVSDKRLLSGMRFLSPDELYRQKPSASLVMIDEAASIPIPLLESFIKQHSRLIFSTTEHGYEGGGRGFAIRFKKILDKQCSQWKQARLQRPCRWAENDPLEKFTFDALLLNAELQKIDKPVINNPKSCNFLEIKREQLIANEVLLHELFALLVSAHYQTRPSDLVRLLDDENYQIFILRSDNKIVATALVAQEGGFSQTLADDIYNGKRRPQGHIIPQILATHAGVKDAPCYIGNRIVRIAVHPELQGQGLGSYFLQCLIASSKKKGIVDYIATSFGATPELVSFWSRAGFQSVHLGMKRGTSSGTHSVVMLLPLSKSSHLLHQRARQNFAASLPLLLADPLRDLEASLVAILFEKIFGESDKALLELTDAESQALAGFYAQKRAYESSISAIYKLTLNRLSQKTHLNREEVQLVIAKVLQKKSWQQLVKISNVAGKKQAVKRLRQAIKKLACQH